MVTLFTQGCPKCAVLEKKLNAKGVKYEVNNSTEELIKLGFHEVPILRVDGEYLKFKEACEWVNKYEEGLDGN